ncbi:caspase family protein [Shimia sp.]|uniref:caspase family protein n=1 Tax=Shimia sp. TaxID=1954381 RepID=UPI0032995141
MMLFRCFGAAIFVLIGCSLSAHAETRALLIGVSDYYDSAEISDLKGPANDVRLMRDVLLSRGAEDIVVVADGVDGGRAPTLAGIEEGFDEITSRAAPGDLVYIHLSGHGTRQLDLEADETDGLDEVFLPADVRAAEKGGRTIPNALTDDRIGALIFAVRAKGANVWLVMDSCHSGSGIRNGGLTAERQVDPAVFNIDVRGAPVRSETAAPAQPELDENAGGYLAFYATRANDVAREGDLSQGVGDPQWYGLFSAALAARLDSGQPLTYRQLFQAVLSDLNHNNNLGASAVQTPLWEGDLIDAPVFGGRRARQVPRFLTEFDEVKAGLVHGVQTGTLLALVADVSAQPNDILGYAQVEEANARSSFIRMVDAACAPQAEALCPAMGTIPTEARFAQVELHPTDRRIGFSPVLDFETGAPLTRNPTLSNKFDAALAEQSTALGIAADVSHDSYDIQVVFRENALWFGPVTAIGAAPVGFRVEVPFRKRNTLSVALNRILRAEHLAKTLDLLDGGAAFGAPLPVALNVEVFPSDISELISPGDPIDVAAECGPVGQAAVQALNSDAFANIEAARDLKQCDVLRFRAKGDKDGQRDVNRIHIDAQYCVHADYELVEGDAEARDVGEMIQMCSDCPRNVYSAGHERLYFLVSELEENGEALNLQGLVETCNGSTRDARGEALSNMLQDLSQTGATRGAMGLLGGATAQKPSVWVQSYRWRVMPRAEVFRDAGVSP